MRILVLAPQWPDPPRQGAAIRNLHILLYLAQRHRVTLLTFESDGEMDKSRLEPLCDHVEVLPAPIRSTQQRLRTFLSSSLPDMAWRLRSDAMMARVLDLRRQTTFDAIHCEGIEMAPYALAAQDTHNGKSEMAFGTNPKSEIVYDAHNAEYLLQRRAFTTDLTRVKRWPKAFYSLVQWWRLRRFERELCLASRHVLAVSEADKEALIRLSSGIGGRIKVLPNGVDPDYWSRDAEYPLAPVGDAGDILVFDGSMDFRPNVDAVQWFVGEVWPLIMAEHSGARFYIVGRNPTREVLALGSTPGITVTGTVDDPRSWVAAATLYVVPMRIGGGVRLKVLQAMAMGCALVSTPVGAEGIAVQHGKEVLIAGSARSFAQATLSLLSDAQHRAALGYAARETAVARYAWQTLLPTLDRAYPRTIA
ncbi:MAG TPA: glycosyltransferase family 4 protein [Chloroflexia bacterium]|nr:glycosyltransferase family 4 protein [Chloroflexia bacterium]